MENAMDVKVEGSSPELDATRDEAAAATERSERMRFVAITAFSLCLGLVTLGLLMFGPLRGLGPVRLLIPQWEMLIIVSALWAVTVYTPISLHHGGNTHLMSLDAVPMCIGLVFLSPPLFVLGCVVSELLVFGILRRQALVKVIFNVTSYACCTAVATLVYRELLDGHSPVSLGGWAALAAALLVFNLASTLNFRLVIRLNGGTAERRSGAQLATEAMVILASICLAIVVLDALWYSVWATVPLFLVAVLIIAVYRGYARLTLRFASLQRLYDFSRALGTSKLEPNSMSVAVLKQVCTVMRARRAFIVVAHTTGVPYRISLDDHEPLRVELITLDPSSFVTETIESGTASMRSTADQDQRGTASDPIAGTYHAAMVAPLTSENMTVGAIVAVDREEELDEFDQDDLLLFDALVAHASANLERARFFEEIQHQKDLYEWQATHDSLTKLANRDLFESKVKTALDETAGVAIALLDLDRFKHVNDTLGHPIGDRLLLEVAERLQKAVPEQATVARFGGDEFAILIPDVRDVQEALAKVHEVHEVFARPIDLDGLTLAVTASAGVTFGPQHGHDVTLLLQRADIAMYVAKENRSGTELYSVEHDKSMQRVLMLSGLLTHALESRTELSVMYHPIADVHSRRIVHVEALARWHHPEHGWIPPDEFIAIAEQMGIVSQITDFVLAKGCAALADWRRAGLYIGLDINVSGRELANGELVEKVVRHLKANDLPPDVLTLEVTETEVMADLLQATRVLDELAGLGIRIAIDDYGTGYSSLSYIHRLPVQELKIDRSFVTNLPNDRSNQVIVRSSIAMAHSLGLSVVAEGAEDEVTCAMLADAGCDLIQGYYLSKPLTPEDLKSWLLGEPRLEFTPLGSDPSAHRALVLSHPGPGASHGI
jgi:diguanylate cyclase (GGDEF)-like protein